MIRSRLARSAHAEHIPAVTTILRGTETATLEISGEIDAPVPAPFTPTGEANLLLFSMRRLTLRALPVSGVDYREALWRIGVTIDGAPAWLAVRCDLDSMLVRALGRRVVRYPTRPARFTLEPNAWTVRTGEGAFEARYREEGDGAGETTTTQARRTFVRHGARTFEIPWEEIPAPSCIRARVEIVSDTLSASTFGARPRWTGHGLALAGRVHMCGVARAV